MKLPHVVIVGGGFGRLSAACAFGRNFKDLLPRARMRWRSILDRIAKGTTDHK